MNGAKFRRATRWLGFGLAGAAAAYGVYVGATWLRFGRGKRPSRPDEVDDLLDLFMPDYEVVERHHVKVNASADITFSTACAMDLQDSGLARVIFKTRELLLGGKAQRDTLPRGLLAQTKALGWTVLTENPGREIVMGAVAQPWKGNVRFQGVAPDEFYEFHEPDYVKIAWTLRVDPNGPENSVFRTETRAVCTDAEARAKFRRYWAFLSPGIILIRWLSLGPLKKAAEYRARKRQRDREAALAL